MPIEPIGGQEIEEYRALLCRLGLDAREGGQHDLREHRRFNFDKPNTKFFVEIGQDTGLLNDLSVGGISFYSSKLYQPGTKLAVTIQRNHHLEVTIVNVSLVPAQSMKNVPYNRHGCQFMNELDGYRCVTTILTDYFDLR